MGISERKDEARFRAALVREREARGISQAQLARSVNKTQQWLWKIEHGEQVIGLQQAIALAAGVGVPLADLLASDERSYDELIAIRDRLKEERRDLATQLQAKRLEVEELASAHLRANAELNDVEVQLFFHPSVEHDDQE